MLNQKHKYMPDVLDCISNLSNDEVFTSPKLANEVLDILPQELFTNPDTKFLDPCCKTGVFLREIAKRLDKGLMDKIPDRQERIDHIMHKQLFGIAITEMTALLSRRTLYCSKYASTIPKDNLWIDKNDGIHEEHSYSISEFSDNDINKFCLNPIHGNIRYNVRIKHNYSNGGTCPYCGASKTQNSEYSHAYELLHLSADFLEVLKDMQFDVIIGNPPYQMKDGGGNGDSAKPIYNIFIEQALKLNPRYLTMIIPSRWMKGGKGLDKFRNMMMGEDAHIREIHDFESAESCFSGVHIDGGVCYFLIDKSYTGKCHFIHTCEDGSVNDSYRNLKITGIDIIIRDNRQTSIIEKTVKLESTENNNAIDTFSSIVSVQKPYGFRTDIFNSPSKYPDADLSDVQKPGYVKLYGVKGVKGGAKRQIGYVKKESIPKKINNIDSFKLFFSKAYSANSTVPPKIIFAGKDEICTETYLEIGSFDTAEKQQNCYKYISTKFFRGLLHFKRASFLFSQDTFGFIPLQDFTSSSDIDWSKSIEDIDKQLYKKYNLSDDDIDFIESNIAPM